MSVVVRSTSTEITVSHKGGTVVVSKPSSDVVVAPSISVSGALGLVTGANVGGGDAEIFRDKISTVLNFRTLSGLGGVAISENGDVVEVDGSSLQTLLLSHNTRHQHGGADEVATATPAANAIPKADGTGKLNSGWMPTGTFTLAAVSAADTTPGFLSDKIVAGAGLTSSILNPAGDEDLQLNIGANPDGSIVVGSDDIKVGVLATDAQHGDRGGGSLHTLAIASGAAGFLSGADKQLIDDLPTTYAPLVHASRHAGAGADPISSLGAHSVTGQLQLTGTDNEIFLNATNSNLVRFANVGVGPPTTTTRSLGTKLLLYDQLSPTLTDHALGVENGGLWFSVSGAATNNQFTWYAGTTPLLYLRGDGLLQFGGQTNTEPAWKRTGTTLEARLADNSGQASISGLTLGLGILSPLDTAHIRESQYARVRIEDTGSSGANSPGLTLYNKGGFEGGLIYVETRDTIELFSGASGSAGAIVVDSTNGNVGIGTALTSPYGRLHIRNGSAGSITPSSDADELVIENNNFAGLSILCPADKSGSIYWADTGSSYAGILQYRHTTDSMAFGTATAVQLLINSTGLLQFAGQTSAEPAWKRNTTSPGPCLEARLADDSDSAFMRAYHLGLNTDPTATHMLFGDEYYSGTLNKLGIGMFPTYIPTTLAANNLYGVQGNVFFGGANWGSGSFVNALQFFPAPDYQHGSVTWGSTNLNLLGISTGGLINIFGRTVTSNTLTGIAVQTLAHIFGAPGAVSANTATAIEVTTPSQTTGTIGVQTGIEIQPQLYGTLNQGLWLSGDGAGSDIVLGAGKDVRFYYDGVDLHLNTSVVAPSDLVLSCGTDKTLELAETVWDDLRVPLTSGRPGLTNPPSWSQYRDNGAASVGVYAWAFSDQALAVNEEELWFQVQLPHNWKEGTDIKPHIHWGIKTAGAANEFVKWGLEYTWANIDGTIGVTTIITSNASSAATATTSGDTTLVINKHYVTDIGTISGTGKTISSMLLCRVFRNSSHADDDLAQDAYGFEVDLHHEIDTLGSRQTLVK